MAIGDLHGDKSLIKKSVERANKEMVDIVILAGDLTLAEKSIENIVGPFIKEGRETLIIPGNHESIATTEFLAELYPSTKNIHGKSFSMRDIGIFGAGTANVGPHQIPDKEIFRMLELSHREIKNSKKKIMVTHIHPFGSKSEMFGFEGSKAVRNAIEKFQPDIAINAHIHQAGGLQEKIGKTIVFNVSRKERIFEI